MKHIGLSLALWLFLAGSLSAQVTVEVLMSQTQFLPNESLPVKVRLVNNSGETIHFGKEDWLAYSIETRDNTVPFKTGEPAQPHDFDVKAAEMATTHADLGPCFDISKPGRYSVTATARIKSWDKEWKSAPVFFDVISGTRFWDQTFGVPQSSTNHGEPEVRKYILQEATLARHKQLYLRVTDGSESKTFKIFSVGTMISFSNPQMRVDQASNLHLFYQEGARVYTYSVINPDGDVMIHQTYYYGGTVPRMKVDDNGTVSILGGVRHLAENDLPRSKKSILTNDIPLPVP